MCWGFGLDMGSDKGVPNEGFGCGMGKIKTWVCERYEL